MSWLPKPNAGFGAFENDRVEPSPDDAVDPVCAAGDRNQMAWSDPFCAGSREERCVVHLDALTIRSDGAGVLLGGEDKSEPKVLGSGWAAHPQMIPHPAAAVGLDRSAALQPTSPATHRFARLGHHPEVYDR